MTKKSKNYFTPSGNKILVKKLEENNKTSGGIIIPDKYFDKNKDCSETSSIVMKGEVLSVGPGLQNKRGKTMPMELKKGDKVLFTQFAHMEIEFQGEKLVMMRETDVVGVTE